MVLLQTSEVFRDLGGLAQMLKSDALVAPEPLFDPEKVLEGLAGCLGQEPATEYDFGLKIGGLYEAR